MLMTAMATPATAMDTGLGGYSLLTLMFAMAAPSHALDNEVGRTPAMGWNSWNAFRCDISEALVLEVARGMISSGLRDAGFVYVNLDDCWMRERGPDGHIVVDSDKFPRGMRPLADDLHAMGFRFGLYSSAGNHTCEGLPGTRGFERIDASDYASWGVDYLKFDYCGMEDAHLSPRHYYEQMRDALNATGRNILFSLCNWGTGQPWLWGRSVANSWRTGRDLFAVWDEKDARQVLKLPGFMQSFMTAVEQQASFHTYVGPGAFNDPDMLLVGLDGMTPYGIVERCPDHLPKGSCRPGDYISREQWGVVGGLTHTEQRAHFSFWCMLAAPLMLGNDPRRMRRSTLDILRAPEVLAISQDALGRQARRVLHEGSLQIWRKDLADGTHALMLFNGGDEAVDMTVRWDRDLPDASRRWQRNVPREPPCEDKLQGTDCVNWARSGECDRNPGFMRTKCMRSCDSCAPALWEGEQATALVRDVWEREYIGIFTALHTARHIEPHDVRVLKIRFEEPGMKTHRTLERLIEEEQGQRAPADTPAPSKREAVVAAETEGAAEEEGAVATSEGVVGLAGLQGGVLLLLPVALIGAYQLGRTGAKAKSEKSFV